MVARKPNEKNTKVEILQAYEELAKEKAALKSQIDQLQKGSQSATLEKPKFEPKTVINQSSTV